MSATAVLMLFLAVQKIQGRCQEGERIAYSRVLDGVALEREQYVCAFGAFVRAPDTTPTPEATKWERASGKLHKCPPCSAPLDVLTALNRCETERRVLAVRDVAHVCEIPVVHIPAAAEVEPPDKPRPSWLPRKIANRLPDSVLRGLMNEQTMELVQGTLVVLVAGFVAWLLFRPKEPKWTDNQ